MATSRDLHMDRMTTRAIDLLETIGGSPEDAPAVLDLMRRGR